MINNKVSFGTTVMVPFGKEDNVATLLLPIASEKIVDDEDINNASFNILSKETKEEDW